VYHTASNCACGRAAGRLLQKTIDEREALKKELATQSAELFALQDRFSSTIANARNQLSTLNRSLKTAKAERQALTEALATQTAELSLTRDQLSSANAANAAEKVSSDLLKQKVQEQEEEIQRTAENLRRARNELNVMRIEKGEIEIPANALQAEIAGLKAQISRLRSGSGRLGPEKEPVVNVEARNDTPRSSEGRASRSHRPTESTRTTNATAGSSRVTSRHFQEPSANSSQMYRDLDEGTPRRRERRENTQRMVECGICMERHPEGQIIPLAPCRHVFCRQCMGSHVGARLQQRSFPVSCPVCMAERRKRNPGSTWTPYVAFEGMEVLTLYFRRHKRSGQTSDHGAAVRYMGGAGTGEIFGFSPLPQVRFTKLSHRQCLTLYPDASELFLRTRKTSPEPIGLCAHCRGVVTYGVGNASSLSARAGPSIRVMVCRNSST
jgi:hypothetical protein